MYDKAKFYLLFFSFKLNFLNLLHCDKEWLPGQIGLAKETSTTLILSFVSDIMMDWRIRRALLLIIR